MVGLALVFVAALTWSKWYPYVLKVGDIADSHAWTTPSVLDKGGAPGDGFSISRGWDYTLAYGKSVWLAYVAVLVVAAAAASFVSRARLRGTMATRTSGGVLGVITLFCTACAAPLAVSLRKDGVRRSVTSTFLVASPVLNPAVIAILALVGPWQWAAVRIVVGLALVVAVALVVRRFDDGAPEPTTIDSGAAPQRFVRRLVLLAVTLTPIYAAITFLQGAFRGVVFPIDGTTAAFAALAIAVVLGTLIDLPTAGEVPIVLAFAAAGVGTAALGALLITLPAISLVTMFMIGRSHGVRVTATLGGLVALAGCVAAVVLPIAT